MAEVHGNMKIIATNRQARFNYSVEESLECGIELFGSEVKSIKASKFSFTDSYATIENLQLSIINLHITQYEYGNRFNHSPDRIKRLLAHKMEIKRLRRKIIEKGLTLIPLKFYLIKGLIKVEIGLCKGKKKFDKREDIKKRDHERETQRDFKFN